MNQLKQQLRLYLVTDAKLCENHGLIETVLQAVEGGVSFVQLRDKTASRQDMIKNAKALKQALTGSGVPIVINDDVHAALEADVDGAHIGQGDMSVQDARAILGPNKILGLSCETPQTVQAADPTLVDYLGLGPVFGTDTKSDHERPIGFSGLAELVSLTSLPNVAIGGLKAIHMADVFEAHSHGLAVVSAICGQENPKQAAQAFSLFADDI